jgi:hypothetical protein
MINTEARNKPRYSTAVTGLLFTALLMLAGVNANLQAQSGDLSLSGGISAGYAPTLTYGNEESSGLLTSLFGDLQYNKLIGRLQASIVLPGSVGIDNFESGYGFFGSLGYNPSLTDKLHLPLMVTGGAAFVSYNNSFGGSPGSTFTDVSPQVGFVVSPYYQLSSLLSLQAAFRWMKGFAAGVESDPINVALASLGIRLTLP